MAKHRRVGQDVRLSFLVRILRLFQKLSPSCPHSLPADAHLPPPEFSVITHSWVTPNDPLRRGLLTGHRSDQDSEPSDFGCDSRWGCNHFQDDVDNSILILRLEHRFVVLVTLSPVRTSSRMTLPGQPRQLVLIPFQSPNSEFTKRDSVSSACATSSNSAGSREQHIPSTAFLFAR
jgi:hypothetical protein